MKITKARLKQIIQEELQKLSEQFPPRVDPSTYAKDKARARRWSPPRMSKAERDELIARHQAAKDKKDDEYLAKRAKEREQERLAADWEKDQAMRDNPGEFTSSEIGGIDVLGVSPSDYTSGNFGTTSFDPEQEYASQAAEDEEAMKASFEKETGMSPGGLDRGERTDDLGREKKSRPRVARKGAGATRIEINKMWKDGKIDKATWRKARRALANKGEAAARLALGAPADSDRAKRAARDAAEKILPSDKLAKLVGGDDKPEAPAVAAKSAGGDDKPEAPTIEDPAIAADIERIEASKRALGRLNSTEQLRDLPVGMRRRINRIAGRYEERGYPRGEAIELARGILGSRIQNKIKRLELEPSVQRMLAKRARGAAGTRAAQAKMRGDSMTAGGDGRPVKESIEKLTSLIAEEFKATLSENEDAKAAIIDRLLKGPQAASYAGRPSKEAADLILQLPEEGRKKLIDAVAAIHSSEAIPKLKDAVKARAAQPKKPAEQSQAAKKPAEQSQAAKKSEAPQDIRRKRDQARERRKTYPGRQARGGKGIPTGGQ